MQAPKETPILFSTPMVQAILDGRKTQTRRAPKKLAEINNSPDNWKLLYDAKTGEPCMSGDDEDEFTFFNGDQMRFFKSPFGQPGDLLWVRETFYINGNNKPIYKASVGSEHMLFSGWKPSIHMPKDACRIWLMVESVHLERLQDISEEDAVAEGIIYDGFTTNFSDKIQRWKYFKDQIGSSPTAKSAFNHLWNAINGLNSWEANPWVWVVKYKVISTSGKPESIISK